METLFDQLARRIGKPARCAAALGISRQAFSQASRRRRLSSAVALRAAALLDLDPGQALLINAKTPAPAPMRETAANLADDIPAQTSETPSPSGSPFDSLYYVK